MKNAIITGASSGIGAQISRQLSKEGYQLHLLGRDKTRLQSVASDCSEDCKIYNFDFTDTTQIQEFSQQWLSNHLTPLKALVLNAGSIDRKSIPETPLSEWEHQFKLSVLGPMTLIKKFWQRIIKDQTAIITIASTLALKPIPDTAAYSALKAAMVNWTSSLANELAQYKVRVNCICPSIVATPIHGNTDVQWHKNISEIVPLGKSGQPDDISEMACFLLSEKAKWITGSTIVIDGGLYNLR